MRPSTTVLIGLIGGLVGCAHEVRRAAPAPLADRVIPCPCTLDGLGSLKSERPSLLVRRDPQRASRRFHPGAAHVFRLFDHDLDPVAGNQCSYDDSGRLIPDGPAAGTPDRCSPERSKLGHALRDVIPYLRHGWSEYHKRGWSPVSADDR